MAGAVYGPSGTPSESRHVGRGFWHRFPEGRTTRDLSTFSEFQDVPTPTPSQTGHTTRPSLSPEEQFGGPYAG